MKTAKNISEHMGLSTEGGLSDHTNNSNYGDDEKLMDFSRNVDVTAIKQIPRTPLTSAADSEGVVLLLGKYKISEEVFKTHEEAAYYVETHMWELLLPVVGIMMENWEKAKNGK